MQNWNRFPRFLLVLSLLIGLCAGMFAPRLGKVEAKPAGQAATNIVISEFRTRGPNGAADEFVEIYNPTNATVTIGGWQLRVLTGTGTEATRATITAGMTLQSGQHYLIANSSANGYSGSVTPDHTYTVGIVDAGGIAIFDDLGVRIDSVGLNTTFTTYTETTPLAALTSDANQSYERISDISGNCIDSNDNSADFFLRNPSDPQNSVSPIVTCGYPTPTPTNTNTPTETATPTNTPTSTFTSTATLTPIPTNALSVLINEIAWAGTGPGLSDDEWIELYNPGNADINITGWKLTAADGTPNITLSGIIPAKGYFLLERGNDNVVSDIQRDQIYTGALTNTGETLTLYDGTNKVIDTANGNGGAWPAGSSSTYGTMERNGVIADSDSAWHTNTGTKKNGKNANGDNILGTPKASNSKLPTPTRTPTKTITPTPNLVRSVLINEIAWAGTGPGLSDDEWIELYNTTSHPVRITGWRLRAADGNPDITLQGTIPAGGYFLLERGHDNVVSDITADQIYPGSGSTNALSNSGEILVLYDGSGRIIDTANLNGGSWPKGSSLTYTTMERSGNIADADTSWHTNNTITRNGKNANGGNILGTPKAGNSAAPTPTPLRTATPTRTPTRTLPPPQPTLDARLIINEILARPGFDWNRDGKADVYDEFIEIKNLSPVNVNTRGWRLDDTANSGASPFNLPDVTLKPGERVVFYSLQTKILLSDGGATIRLINPGGKVYDTYTYTFARTADRSFCRIPDGSFTDSSWVEDCLPTPNLVNTREGSVPTVPGGNVELVCELPDTLPADFLIAECHGYGSNIWNPYYWDQRGWQGRKFIHETDVRWESFVE